MSSQWGECDRTWFVPNIKYEQTDADAKKMFDLMTKEEIEQIVTFIRKQFALYDK